MHSLTNFATAASLHMNLYLLRQTAGLTVYYDCSNDWLFLDWEGEITLPVVQQACLAIADCYLQRPYSHILNNNERVTDVSWSIARWLTTEFLPHMRLAGAEQVAWVFSPALPGLNLVQTLISWLPGSPITTFYDIADAVAWLRQSRIGQRTSLLTQRLPTVQAQVAQEVQALHERVTAKQHNLEPA